MIPGLADALDRGDADALVGATDRAVAHIAVKLWRTPPAPRGGRAITARQRRNPRAGSSFESLEFWNCSSPVFCVRPLFGIAFGPQASRANRL
jgi:hypothetical protein